MERGTCSIADCPCAAFDAVDDQPKLCECGHKGFEHDLLRPPMVGITIFVTERNGTDQGRMLGSQDGYLATLRYYGVECLMQNGIKIPDFGSLEDKGKYTLGTNAASLPPPQPNTHVTTQFPSYEFGYLPQQPQPTTAHYLQQPLVIDQLVL
jgi:hypothetical protein